MKYIITSIKDELKGFATFELNEKIEVAKRNFETLCKNSDEIKIHKEDYSLAKLGEYDKETGEIVSKVEIIVTASDILKE